MVLCVTAAWNVLCLSSFPSILQPDCSSLVFPISWGGRRWGGLSTNIFTSISCTSVNLLWQSNSTGIKDPTCCQMPEELSSIFMSVTVQWRCFSPWFLEAKVDYSYIIYRFGGLCSGMPENPLRRSRDQRQPGPEKIMWGTAGSACTRGVCARLLQDRELLSGVLGVAFSLTNCWQHSLCGNTSMAHWSCSGVTINM